METLELACRISAAVGALLFVNGVVLGFMGSIFGWWK